MSNNVWAIKWRSKNKLDGETEQLIGRFHKFSKNEPDFLSGYNIMTFTTRDQARKFIKEHYNYIKDRPDLRKEPHGWKMPIPVKVQVEIKEL